MKSGKDLPLMMNNINQKDPYMNSNNVVRRLLKDKAFRRDFPAQKSFSKLRAAIAGLYIKQGLIREYKDGKWGKDLDHYGYKRID